MGELCPNCNGFAEIFCLECAAGEALLTVMRSLFCLDRQREGLQCSVDSKQSDLKAFRELVQKWDEVLTENFSYIEKLCTSLLLDPYFLKQAQRERWEFKEKRWPVITFNDPKPFGIQLANWLDAMLKGLNPILPQHYDLKVLFLQLRLLSACCPYWTVEDPLAPKLHMEFSLKVRLIHSRLQRWGWSEEALSGVWYPQELLEIELFPLNS